MRSYWPKISYRIPTSTFINKEHIALMLYGGAYTSVVAYYLQQRQKGPSKIKRAIAGSLAFTAGELLLFPLDSINMKFKAENIRLSLTSFAKESFKQLGFQFFTKGSQALLYSASIGGFIYFYLFESLRKKFHDSNSTIIALMINAPITYPLEVIKTRMQVSQNKDVSFSNEISKLLSQISEANGINNKMRTLFRGIIPSSLNSVGYMFAQYGFYLHFRKVLKKYCTKMNDNVSISLSSCISGMLASILTNGFETWLF